MKKGNLWKSCLSLVAAAMLLTGCGSKSDTATSEAVAVCPVSGADCRSRISGGYSDD